MASEGNEKGKTISAIIPFACARSEHILQNYNFKNHAKGVYIINSEGIVYHQHEVLYLIKPQGNTRWRVMICSPEGADDMHRTSCGDDMPSLRLG